MVEESCLVTGLVVSDMAQSETVFLVFEETEYQILQIVVVQAETAALYVFPLTEV